MPQMIIDFDEKENDKIKEYAEAQKISKMRAVKEMIRRFSLDGNN